MKTGGLRAAPTPPGVPVMITSPRSRVIATLIVAISAGTLKMSRSVRESCITRPFNRPWMRNPRAPGGTVSGVTSHGPNDPVPSKFFHGPLRRAELKITHARIVEQRVACHLIEGLLLGDAAPLLA